MRDWRRRDWIIGAVSLAIYFALLWFVIVPLLDTGGETCTLGYGGQVDC